MPDEPRGTVRPSTWRGVAVAFVIGGCLGVVIKSVLDTVRGAAPAPVGTGVVLLVMALGVGVIWRIARRRIHLEHDLVPPAQAVRWLTLAKTSILGGAALGGGFVAYAALSLPRWAAPLGRERVLWSAAATLGSALLAVAGWLLERACRVPTPPDDEPGSPSSSG